MVGTLKLGASSYGLVQTKDGLIHRVLPGNRVAVVGAYRDGQETRSETVLQNVTLGPRKVRGLSRGEAREGVRRVEDARLLRGQGKYTGALLPGALAVVVPVPCWSASLAVPWRWNDHHQHRRR